MSLSHAIATLLQKAAVNLLVVGNSNADPVYIQFS